MAIDKHIKRGHPITFGLIILFGIFELSLSAWLTARFADRHDESNGSERDRVHFVLFTSAWTVILSVFYSILFYHSKTGILVSVASHLVFLLFTWILWTASAASVTQLLGGGLNCSTQKEFVYCSQLNALEGFAWVEWGLITFAVFFVLIRGIIAARRGDGYRGSLV